MYISYLIFETLFLEMDIIYNSCFTYFCFEFFCSYDSQWSRANLTPMRLRENVTASLTTLMFGKSFLWNYDYKDPEEWIDWMSCDMIDCDHYFIELAAEYLNRRILIYPLFENEVNYAKNHYTYLIEFLNRLD